MLFRSRERERERERERITGYGQQVKMREKTQNKHGNKETKKAQTPNIYTAPSRETRIQEEPGGNKATEEGQHMYRQNENKIKTRKKSTLFRLSSSVIPFVPFYVLIFYFIF